MRTAITEVANRVPEQLAADRRRLADLEHQIDNLVDLLAGGNIQSSAVATRPSGAEAEAERIRERIEEAERLLTLPAEMPDDAWIAKQLGDMHAVLRDDERQTATLLRKLIGQVEAHQVLPPGKTRGYAQLRFKINGWEVIRSLLEGRLRDGSFELLIPDPTSAEGISPEFRIDLGGPTLMDQWAPKIAKMRAQRMKWTEIVEITGLDLNRAYCAWKRYVDAQQREHDADSRQKPLRDLDGEPGVAPEDIPEETSEGREDAA
jgi:hypothetical protein